MVQRASNTLPGRPPPAARLAPEFPIKTFYRLFLLVPALGFAADARGSGPHDPATQAAVGAGGTTLATVDDLGSILAAPAVLSLASRYEVGGGAALGPDGEISYQAAAVDSRTGPVTLGLSFQRRTGTLSHDSGELPGWVEPGADLENPEATQTIGGAVAGSWLDRRIGVAAGLTWNQRAVFYGEQSSSVDGILSVAGRVGEIGRLSLTGRNFIFHKLESTPLTVAAGGGVESVDIGRVEADLVLDMGTELTDVAVGMRAGGELTIAGLVPLRAGVQRDARADEWLATAGVGVGNEQVSLDYGFRIRLGESGGGEDGAWDEFTGRTWHGLSLLLRL